MSFRGHKCAENIGLDMPHSCGTLVSNCAEPYACGRCAQKERCSLVDQRPPNYYVFLYTLLSTMLATQLIKWQCSTSLLFHTGGIRRSAPPPFTSEGHASKRDCSTSLTLTSIASEESKPETSPRDGASAMLAELGTLSYTPAHSLHTPTSLHH